MLCPNCRRHCEGWRRLSVFAVRSIYKTDRRRPPWLILTVKVALVPGGFESRQYLFVRDAELFQLIRDLMEFCVAMIYIRKKWLEVFDFVVARMIDPAYSSEFQFQFVAAHL